MKFAVLFGHQRAEGHRNDACLLGIGAENREFLEHETQIRIRLGQGEHVFLRALAVAAIVIIELDDGGLAVGVADIAVVGGIEDLLPGVLDDLEMGDSLLLCLLGLERLLHVEQNLGVVDEIIADDQLDLGAVDIG